VEDPTKPDLDLKAATDLSQYLIDLTCLKANVYVLEDSLPLRNVSIALLKAKM